MKRWILVLTVVVAGAVSLAHADYVKIMINVGGSPDRRAATQPGTGPAAPGGGGEFGIGGGGGAAGVGAPGGAGGPGGLGSRLPGIGSGPGALGGGSPDAGGNPGAGGAGLGDIGPGGRVGGGGAGSLGGGTPGAGLPGSGNLGDALLPGDGLDSRAIWVEAVIEFEGKDGMSDRTRTMYRVKHKYGTTWMPIPLPPMPGVQMPVRQGAITAFIHPDYRLFHIKGPTVAQRYENKKKEMARLKKDNSATDLLDLADWCLQHGLLNEVPNIMEKVAKLDPKLPVVAAFQKTEEALRRAPNPGDDGEVWRERFGNFKMLEPSRHYRVVYEESEELAKKLKDRLETNFRAFYYWWALKGHVLPVPEKRLLAIQVETPEAFERYREIFDAAPMSGDSILARRDNVAIISSKRLDPAYDALSKSARPLLLPYSRDDLLAAKGWKRDRSPTETAYAQTVTLLQEALQDEAGLMAATHEGTRQLIAAVGMLPRTIVAPQWIDSGMGSFFETPKGAFWPGTGAPNWAHLAIWKKMETDKKLDGARVALKGVVTDRYFRDAVEMIAKEKEEREKVAKSGDRPAAEPEKEKEKDKDTAEKAMARARALSWGLTYFIAQSRRAELQRYYRELQQLPRDLLLDEDVLWLTFARAFDLTKAGKPGEVDDEKAFRFANEWQKHIKVVPLPAADLQADINKAKDGKSPGG